jgi:hypothetical protein
MKQGLENRKMTGEIKKKNRAGNVHTKVTLRHLNVTIVDVEKQ